MLRIQVVLFAAIVLVSVAGVIRTTLVLRGAAVAPAEGANGASSSTSGDDLVFGAGGLQPRRQRMRRRVRQLVGAGEVPGDDNNPDTPLPPLPNNTPSDNGDPNGIGLTDPKHQGRGDGDQPKQNTGKLAGEGGGGSGAAAGGEEEDGGM